MTQNKTYLLKLPVSSGEEKKTFELINVGNNTFRLKTKDTTSVLYKNLEKWLHNNISISEKDYEKLIDLRRGTNIELKESVSSFDNEIDSFRLKSDSQLNANDSIQKEVDNLFEKKNPKLTVDNNKILQNSIDNLTKENKDLSTNIDVLNKTVHDLQNKVEVKKINFSNQKEIKKNNIQLNNDNSKLKYNL